MTLFYPETHNGYSSRELLGKSFVLWKVRHGRKCFLFFCGTMSYLHMMLDCGTISQHGGEVACDGKADTLRVAGQKMESNVDLKDRF